MSITKPARIASFAPDVLARMRETLVDAIETNDRQAESVAVGPERDAHRVARASLQEALERLDAGTYGACTACRDALPIERLELVPDAELCMTCVQRPRALYG